ncbi:hypothetical protein GY50_0316 [Dehalococcoides mccartyi GY50]|nr:hypothetical protein GY50_0316 [Dehalococcoides mccartyi GY50]
MCSAFKKPQACFSLITARSGLYAILKTDFWGGCTWNQ